MDNPIGIEKGFVESASTGNNSGSLQEMIMGGIMKSASGTADFYSSLPDQSNPILGDDGKLELKTISKNKFFLQKK